MLIAYVVFHLLINATLVQTGDLYQTQVRKIHELPFLWIIEWLFVYIPIVYHAGYGIWITVACQPNNLNYPYAKNWLYILQRVSAVIVAMFVLFHVFALRVGLFGQTLSFDPNAAASTMHRHISASRCLAYVVYPVGILAACFHLANGLWAGAITWGLTVSAGAQRRWGYLCILLFLITLILGLTALIAALGPPTLPTKH
jgi:succinate dehydrogenase / fumarate reductase cytochrome b subunit